MVDIVRGNCYNSFKLNNTKGKNMLKKLIPTAMVTILGCGFVYAASTALAAPDVYFSYATNACVEVINYTDTIHSCENLPAKFNHYWSK